jgi:iron complex outermembrane recepter protein
MFKYTFLSAIALLFCATSFAQESSYDDDLLAIFDTIKNKKGEILKEVQIIGNQQKNASVIKSGIKPMDLPQSIQVISGAVIEQQQSIRLSDVIKNANGVYVGSARGGAQESFWSRGYDMSANNIFKNGFRFNSGSMPEVSSLEKVEILKGGSALLFGNVAPGGILNMVTKTPQFKFGGEATMQAGSYNFYKPSLDLYGPISNVIAFRINGSYENSESFRDVVTRERYYVNPSFLFKLSPKTDITLQGDYLNDDWMPDFGTGMIGTEIADVPRDAFLGARWSNGKTTQATTTLLLNHQFNNDWRLSFNASFQEYERAIAGTERIVPAADGTWIRPLLRNKAAEQIYANQISLQGNFNTGKIKHQLFTGIDTEKSFADAYTYRYFNPAVLDANDKPVTVTNYDTINIFDPSTYENIDELPIPPSEVTRIVKTETNRYGIYAQDLISITNKFKVLAGLRYTIQEAKPVTYNLVTTVEADKVQPGTIRNDRAFSPKVGLIYQPNKTISLFSSYSNSFTPNTGVTIFNQAIKPSIIDQFEAGVKKEFFKGILSTNVTVYQIVNSNLAQTAEFDANGNVNTNTDVKTLTGETTSKGVEIDIIVKPSDAFNILAGYSYNDMRFTKTSGLNGSFIEGDRVARTPANTANLSFFYTLQSGTLKGLSIGAIGNYIGNRVAGWNNQYDSTRPGGIWEREIPLEGYTTIDFSLGYNWDKFSILCKLSNITDELNYTVHENYSVNPIAPRQFLTSLRYKF